jgi:hypothetical protein
LGVGLGVGDEVEDGLQEFVGLGFASVLLGFVEDGRCEGGQGVCVVAGAVDGFYHGLHLEFRNYESIREEQFQKIT